MFTSTLALKPVRLVDTLPNVSRSIMWVAVLNDIHGLPALDAVLDEVLRTGIDRIP